MAKSVRDGKDRQGWQRLSEMEKASGIAKTVRDGKEHQGCSVSGGLTRLIIGSKTRILEHKARILESKVTILENKASTLKNMRQPKHVFFYYCSPVQKSTQS